MAFIRTFGQLKPSKPVAGVSVRVVTDGEAKVTDIQLNPGSSLFSWSPQVGDLGLRSAPAWRFINGMVQSDYETWVMADEDLASPYQGVLYPVGTQEVRWGMLYWGEISSRQEFNGYDYRITTGAGTTPHLTARADQRLDLVTGGIMSAIVAVRGIHSDPGDPTRSDLGTVTVAHPDGWSAVWAWHETWDDVLTEHGGW
uniref:Minor tail protein n=1 Tax=Micrococcus phage Olihed TaxID=3092209 RepID=A0AAU6R613_9CAUD